MRAIVTGQVGVDKGPYVDAVKAEARARKIVLEVCHGGQMMYAEAPDVGRGVPTTQTIYRLILEPWRKKAYLSFPMTHVMDLPDTLAEIDAFKRSMHEHFICFDPADVDEFCIHMDAVRALQEGRTTIEVQ